jgi:hypothetical protein
MSYIIEDNSTGTTSRVRIVGGELQGEEAVVILHIKKSEDFFIANDSCGNPHLIAVPVDSIDTLISALTKFKEMIN